MEARRKFDAQFKEGAVRIVRETGKPIAQVARELGISDGTLGSWVRQDERARPVQGRRRPDRSGDRQTDRAGCS
ncbi:transposase [Mycobacterium canetti]|uniref:transposase n=1 Tax=Mycobacterium canetti TaxID=78331 RepID=UPI00399D6A93